MLLDIPESIYGSFYRGQVYVGVKDLVLEPSSPIRHITEASKFLECEQNQKPILLIYTDGGPDHRLAYLSVKLSLICLFLHGKYDMLVAVRTPPFELLEKSSREDNVNSKFSPTKCWLDA